MNAHIRTKTGERHEQEEAVGSLGDLPRRHKRSQGETSG
jgi:hypothetical protein